MSGKIIVASAATILLASIGLASAATNATRHHKQTPRYYNMVPAQVPNDPAPYDPAPYSAPNFADPYGTGVTGQGAGL